jgi:putative holliday junction resolvase
LSDRLPKWGRLLGVDVGTVRVGLAITDPDRIIASPLSIYARVSEADDAVYFQQLILREKIVGLVVGFPIRLDGSEGPKAVECKAYAAWLTLITNLPAILWDERFTTANAEDALWDAGLSHKKRKSKRDSVAAQLILSGFLESLSK